MITDQQARAIAYLLHEIRPDWPVASLMSLIDKHRDVPSLGALTIAATTKAMESTCQTPGPIFHPGPHWPEAARSHLPRPPSCEDHIGQESTSCRSCWADFKAGDRPQTHIGKHYEAPATAGASDIEGEQR
ncbi:hypothetical protein SAMN04487912_102377 [Arthrobacter sp. cf158]|uniref:hypothetical protein n=1 Tax=Arthrobacter sp. cf158 TaxID=1761744 RepID=UPI00089D0578|nr:hypothetical protein [Arthrobacter sp. cf158]SDW33706.1 hypothetical protein SAMN04487912_102377 [Arthrobacter sp. cf158]